MTIEIVPIGQLRCELGEGLHWDSGRHCLWGVDIQGRMVWRWLPGDVEITRWHVDQRVGWVLPIAGSFEHVLLGLQEGVARVDIATMAVRQWLQRPFEGKRALRLNDAKADSTGAVWCGSLNNDDEGQPDGCLYRLGVDGDWKFVDSGYTVANGPAIDATGTVLMHTDSGRRTIYQFDLDVALGTISRKRVWKVFTESEGYPDGMCFDDEGCLWVAHWGAGCISRFAPDGALLVRIDMPTSHITNVCFGGQGLDRLFVTSARVGLTPIQRDRERYAGCLFEVIGHGQRGLNPHSASPFCKV